MSEFKFKNGPSELDLIEIELKKLEAEHEGNPLSDEQELIAQAGGDAKWLSQESTFVAVHMLFGLPVPTVWGDGEEPCPLIWSNDIKEPTDCKGGWITADDGKYLYCLFHRGTGAQKATYTLVEFYANLLTKGKVHSLKTSGERGTWLARMLADLGIISLPVLGYRPLGSEWSDEARRVYEGLVTLTRCHMRTDPTKPETLFSVDFGHLWCGVARETFRKYRNQLQRRGYIQKTGVFQKQAEFYRLVPDEL